MFPRDHPKWEEYLVAFSDALEVPENKFALVNSGNGYHVYLMIEEIEGEDCMERTKKAYSKLVDSVQTVMEHNGLSGYLEKPVWSQAKTLRVPGTYNTKDEKNWKMCEVVFLGSDFQTPCDIKLKEENVTARQVEKGLEYLSNTYDTEAVLEGCAFMVHVSENAATLSEPDWHKGTIGIGSYLENGRDLVHQLSEPHPTYSPEETDQKIDAWRSNATGPSRCDSIKQIFDGCATCPHKVVSPVNIRGEKFLKSKANGFRVMRLNKQGKTVPGKVHLEDLVKHFHYEYDILTYNGDLYQKNGTHHEAWVDKNEIKHVIQETVEGDVSTQEQREILNRIYIFKVKNDAQVNPENLLNMKNGVFNLETGLFQEKNPNIMFTYTLDYGYDPDASSPQFDKFISEIMCGDNELIETLQMYLGYAISGCPPWRAEKALVCVGDGANGKSTLVSVLASLVGSNAISFVNFEGLGSPTSRIEMVGKLINIVEEFPSTKINSSTFKTIVSGGAIKVKRLYSQETSLVLPAKQILTGNEMFKNFDSSKGMFRKLLLVPFNATFEGEDQKRNLRDTLNQELTGIFNWVYDGYKKLVANNYKFKTGYQTKLMMDDFVEDSDLTKAWISSNIRETEGEEWFPIKDIYLEYKEHITQYCSRYDLVPINIFSRKIKQVYKRAIRKRKNVETMGQCYQATVVRGIKPVFKLAPCKIQGEETKPDNLIPI
jgi:P4 family phage/plasmid primase-like protien